MTAACGLPWLTLMGRPGSLAVFLHCKCWPTSDSFFVSTTKAHLSELCECPVLPLVESGKHYRISLENLLKPAQNSSTFRGSSLVSYCKFIHTENLALYSSYWCDQFFFPYMSSSRDSLKFSFLVVFLRFLKFPVQRFHWRTPLPCCLNLLFSIIWCSNFFCITCVLFSRECCLFQL